LVNLGGPSKGKCGWNVCPLGTFLRPLGMCYVHVEYFSVIWYIFHRFGYICCTVYKSGNPVPKQPILLFVTGAQFGWFVRRKTAPTGCGKH
jgi:hypothetical protein